MLNFLTSVLLCRYTPSPTLPPVQYTTQVWHLQRISSTLDHHVPSVILALCRPSIYNNISTMDFCVHAGPLRSSNDKGKSAAGCLPACTVSQRNRMPMDKFGMDPHDAKGFDSSSTFGKGGEMQKGDAKKDIPSSPAMLHRPGKTPALLVTPLKEGPVAGQHDTLREKLQGQGSGNNIPLAMANRVLLLNSPCRLQLVCPPAAGAWTFGEFADSTCVR